MLGGCWPRWHRGSEGLTLPSRRARSGDLRPLQGFSASTSGVGRPGEWWAGAEAPGPPEQRLRTSCGERFSPQRSWGPFGSKPCSLCGPGSRLREARKRNTPAPFTLPAVRGARGPGLSLQGVRTGCGGEQSRLSLTSGARQLPAHIRWARVEKWIGPNWAAPPGRWRLEVRGLWLSGKHGLCQQRPPTGLGPPACCPSLLPQPFLDG